MSLRMLPLACLLALTACKKEEPTPTDTEPTGSDTDSGGPVDRGLVPVAVGIELDAAIDLTGNLVAYNDPQDDTVQYPPYFILTFATEAYFSTGADSETCVALAEVDAKTTTPLFRKAHFDNEDNAEMYQAYQTTITLDPQLTTCPGNVNETMFGADASGLLDRWNGATIGIGFAPIDANTDLYNTLGTQTTSDDDVLNSLFTQYIALVDTNGGFEGQALDVGIAFEFDAATGDLVADPKDDTILDRKDISNLKPTDLVAPTYIRSNAWFFPTLAALPEDLTKK